MISFEQIIDDVDRAFSASSSNDENIHSLEIALDLAKNYGGNALNAAGMSSNLNAIAWAKASMSNQWMQHYLERKYSEVDPFLIDLLNGGDHLAIEAGSPPPHAIDNVLARELNQELKNYGYNSLFSSSTEENSKGDRTMVVFCSEMNMGDINRHIGISSVRLLCSLLSLRIKDTKTSGSSNFIDVTRVLTLREEEVLKWLAVGLRNAEIAYKLGIAEVSVRKHVINIRKKLNAKTREQAIAVAIHDRIISI